ncbi:ATP-binding protein [Streptomyces sp. NBC_01754]|uniref:ATP-binding protein n=1 Tax=Streptomyces sp. NBC_01754 TaxID=2975930 RepID=UPI002DD86DA9|nr:ATP-binding protein [Streptomyces sp. NBC_01754]WSC94857.1 ATP-binding protein [Streptomyces sp. NBC_01754]
MEPTDRGPGDYGHGTGSSAEGAVPRRQPRDPLTPDFGLQTPQRSRAVQLITGDFLLTVNPVDGSEIEPCPPGERPEAPVRRTAAERAERERATSPPAPPGPPAARPPLLERGQERERLVRLLARGRSVRLTGPAGSGRTALLEAVAADCADLAPDGVVHLSGHRRTASELLYELFEAVHRSPLYRPGREALRERVGGIGAVVVLDDLELGGTALEELLDATPECAFLFGASPDVPAPTADSNVEEVFLAGLGRGASVELLENVVERPLTDEEANWAGDLWFESEGLPLRFVQAGALLRQRDQLSTDPEDFDGYDDPDASPFGRAAPVDVPLPSLGEGAAPAALLASRMSEAARETLRFAVALGGEVPHQAHLPALVGDTHADAALGELSACGLLSPAGPRYRLAAGVLDQLVAGGYGEDADTFARNAAQHYAWWAGHPSVTPERAVAEADAVLASMTHLVQGDRPGAASTAVLLARSASPAFAAGMRWGAWEKALRAGQEAARVAGEVAEEAYFHHELGVLALCTGHLDRARTELETSVGMRGALADKPGAVAGRRALALVTDLSGGPVVQGGRAAAGEEVTAVRHEESLSPSGVPGATAVMPVSGWKAEDPSTPVSPRAVPAAARPTGLSSIGHRALQGARRNLVAVGAGALLAAVLGTVVTLGATSDSEDPENQNVTTEQEAGVDDSERGLSADEPAGDEPAAGVTAGPGASVPGPSHSASPSGGGTPEGETSEPGTSPSSDDPTSGGPSDPPPSQDPSPSGKPTDPGTTPTPSGPPDPTETTPDPTETAPTDPPSEPPESTDSASGPAESATASATGTDPVPDDTSGTVPTTLV